MTDALLQRRMEQYASHMTDQKSASDVDPNDAGTSNAHANPKQTYNWRLVSEHAGDDNETLHVDCQMAREGEEFAPFALEALNSPFLNFLYCALLCQLAYLRMNAAERGLRFQRVDGELCVVAEEFVIRELTATFTMHLVSGEPTDEDLSYIQNRCLTCPVSRNLQSVARKETRVQYRAVTPN